MLNQNSARQDKPIETIEQFLDKVVDLPPAPQILPKLLALLRDEETDLNKVIDLVTFDPGLTIKVMNVSNSAFFGLPNKVNSVFEAVQQLGSQQLYRIVTAGAGRRLFLSPYWGTNGKQIDPWRQAVMTAFASQFIAENIGADPATMFMAGLLHDVGRVPLLLAFKDDYWAFQQANAEAPQTEDTEMEIRRFGFDHASLGGRLLERWKFSQQIVSSVSAHHAPLEASESDMRPLAACVSLGEVLAKSNAITDPKEMLSHEDTVRATEILRQTPKDLSRYQDLIAENMDFIEAMCKSN